MLPPWRKGVVVRIEAENEATRRFWIKIPELEQFDFEPGQFVTLDLPIHEKANKRWRSYSIASWPDGSNVFELIIVRLKEGAGTNYLFNETKQGTELSIRGPQGVFTLPASIEQDIFLICTGTGVAPFRSMVQHVYQQQIPHKNIYLIFGCRTQNDLLYYNELNHLQSNMPQFYYMPTLSRENWEGRKGYVHAVYEDICEKIKLETGQPANAIFYLCGWKNMIAEAKQRILAMGFDKKNIRQELYG
jgi:ferredoxin-NADP reductase